MARALHRGEYVEFPFGYLKAVQRRWDWPFTVEHIPGEDGGRLLEGGTRLPWSPGWSRKVDKRSLVYLWDQALERGHKARMKELKRIVREGKRKLLAVNNSLKSGK